MLHHKIIWITQCQHDLFQHFPIWAWLLLLSCPCRTDQEQVTCSNKQISLTAVPPNWKKDYLNTYIVCVTWWKHIYDNIGYTDWSCPFVSSMTILDKLSDYCPTVMHILPAHYNNRMFLLVESKANLIYIANRDCSSYHWIEFWNLLHSLLILTKPCQITHFHLKRWARCPETSLITLPSVVAVRHTCRPQYHYDNTLNM